MHVADGLAELRPRLPAGFDDFEMRQAGGHLADGLIERTTAFVASGGHPQFDVGTEFGGDLDGGSGGGHEVLERTSGAEGSDAERASPVAGARDGGGVFEMVKVGQPSGGNAVSIRDPVNEALVIGGNAEIPGGAFEIGPFTDQAHGARVGLQEAEIGMAGDEEVGIGKIIGERS